MLCKGVLLRALTKVNESIATGETAPRANSWRVLKVSQRLSVLSVIFTKANRNDNVFSSSSAECYRRRRLVWLVELIFGGVNREASRVNSSGQKRADRNVIPKLRKKFFEPRVRIASTTIAKSRNFATTCRVPRRFITLRLHRTTHFRRNGL